MAKLQIAGGAEIDLATGDDLARLGGKLDSLFAAVVPPSVYVRRPGTGVTPTSSTLPTYIDLGGPVNGVMWSVRMVTLQWVASGAPGWYGAAVPQPVAVFVTGAAVSQITPVDVVDLGAATPVSFLYASDQLVAQAPERVFVGVLATAAQVTAAGQFIATVRAVQVPLRAQSSIDTEYNVGS